MASITLENTDNDKDTVISVMTKSLNGVLQLQRSELDTLIITSDVLNNLDINNLKVTIVAYITDLVDVIKTDLDNIQPIQVTYHSTNFDPLQTYIPRSQRKEWSPIGLLGKIYVIDNGSCVVGSKCSCENGIAIPGTDWRILERKTANIIRILYK